MISLLRLPLILSLGALALTSPARAEGGTTFDSVGDRARWSDKVSNAAAPDPSVCTQVTCRSYDLELRLPRGAWSQPGGLLVSLRWPTEQQDAGYDLDLYLYGPSGSVVAKANSIAYASAEGLWLQSPENGRYRIVIAPRDVVGTSPFDVFATAKRGWSIRTTSSLLGAGELTDPLTSYVSRLTFLGRPPNTPRSMVPDLVPERPDNFHIETTAAASFYVATMRVPAHQPSCYPQEITGLTADEPGTQEPVLRCLRWDMVIHNAGPGPFEIRAYPQSETPTDAYQAIYSSDGSYVLRRVGDARFSSAHGHVHARGLDEIGLWTIRSDGSPGRLVGKPPEKGMCHLDLINPSFGTPADGPARYVYPSTCDAEDNRDPKDPLYPDEPYFRMGTSSGWADIYPWHIPDQYIDITNVPDGRYLLIHRVNVAGAIQEADHTNNAASACVEFHDTTVRACGPRSRAGRKR